MMQISRLVVDKKAKPEIGSAPDELKSTLRRCFEHAPDTRPRFTELHSIFASLLKAKRKSTESELRELTAAMVDEHESDRASLLAENAALQKALSDATTETVKERMRSAALELHGTSLRTELAECRDALQCESRQRECSAALAERLACGIICAHTAQRPYILYIIRLNTTLIMLCSTQPKFLKWT